MKQIVETLIELCQLYRCVCFIPVGIPIIFMGIIRFLRQSSSIVPDLMSPGIKFLGPVVVFSVIGACCSNLLQMDLNAAAGCIFVWLIMGGLIGIRLLFR